LVKIEQAGLKSRLYCIGQYRKQQVIMQSKLMADLNFDTASLFARWLSVLP